MRSPAVEAQVVNTNGFNVPCRRFLITSNVTRDRRLPLVDEFVLRLLKVTGPIEVTRLAAFFGFNAGEAATVKEDLQARGLVEVSVDHVDLAPRAQELFRTSSDGLPRMIEVETWIDRLWFDLVSRNMVTPERARPLDFLVTLKPRNDAKSIGAAFARSAFEQNFTDFLRRVRRINNPDAIALYSVSDVSPDRFGMVVSSGEIELQFDPEPRLIPKLIGISAEELARYRPLQDEMQDALRRLSFAEPSQAGLLEFRRLTGDTLVIEHHSTLDRFDLASWLTNSSSRGRNDRRPVFGASYIPRNSEALRRLITREAMPRLRGMRRDRPMDLYWFRPVGTGWGASMDLPRVVGEIVALARQEVPGVELRTSVISTPIAANETRNRFRRVFDRGLSAPPGYLTAATEVVYLQGIAAMVLTQAALSGATSVAVGYVMAAEADLRYLEHGLKFPVLERTGEVLWDRVATSDVEQTPGVIPTRVLD